MIVEQLETDLSEYVDVVDSDIVIKLLFERIPELEHYSTPMVPNANFLKERYPI